MMSDPDALGALAINLGVTLARVAVVFFTAVRLSRAYFFRLPSTTGASGGSKKRHTTKRIPCVA
jgi:hypothetical protein